LFPGRSGSEFEVFVCVFPPFNARIYAFNTNIPCSSRTETDSRAKRGANYAREVPPSSSSTVRGLSLRSESTIMSKPRLVDSGSVQLPSQAIRSVVLDALARVYSAVELNGRRDFQSEIAALAECVELLDSVLNSFLSDRSAGQVEEVRRVTTVVCIIWVSRNAIEGSGTARHLYWPGIDSGNSSTIERGRASYMSRLI
jgi:hypothetical protein